MHCVRNFRSGEHSQCSYFIELQKMEVMPTRYAMNFREDRERTRYEQSRTAELALL